MSAPGGFGPARPGVGLSIDQNTNAFRAISTLIIIGTAAAILRLAAGLKTKEGFAVDDSVIFCALFFSYGTETCALVSLMYGSGKHLQSLTRTDMTKLYKVLFAYVQVYATAVSCTKVSIVMFYRRIFNLRLSFYFATFFVVGYWISVVVVAICASCRPLPCLWNQWTHPDMKGVCMDNNSFYLGNGIAAMMVDIIILSVPVPIIRKLKMPRSQKSAVIGRLLLGGFVCVASVIRIDRSDDPTWALAPVFLWSCVESFIGIVCACLPAFAPFFRHCGRPLSPGNRPVQDSMRTKQSDDELGYPMTSITVREDVQIPYSSRK